MYDTILVPTDGSPHADRAVAHALGFADRFDATVHLLGVVDVQGAAGLFDAGGVDDAFVDRLESEARDRLDAALATADDADRVRTVLRRGDPAETILDYADEVDADVVAMGTHGRTGLRRFVAGSVTEHVVRAAGVPVLTVRALEDVQDDVVSYDDVLVPTDGSDAAAAAVDHAVAIAAAYDATLHALNVVDLGVMAAQSDVVPSGELFDALEETGEAATASVAERARAAGVDVETAVIEGFPARDLLDYAEEAGVDLVVMGTHGRSGIERFVLGSVTERTVRHATMPVLTVRSPHEDE